MSEPQIAVMSHLVQAGHGYLWLSDYRKCCDPPQVGQLGKLFSARDRNCRRSLPYGQHGSGAATFHASDTHYHVDR